MDPRRYTCLKLVFRFVLMCLPWKGQAFFLFTASGALFASDLDETNHSLAVANLISIIQKGRRAYIPFYLLALLSP